jgi:NAD(P)-dependent dehydrogenase (short-subunit alcohol dehydrogenase family)
MGILEGRVAIVTGGGSGIGRAVAVELANQGASLIVADLGCDVTGVGRDPEPARSVARYIAERGGRALAVCADVSKPEDCRDLVEQALKGFGRIDVLCHCAGVLRQGLVFELNEDDWDAVYNVHVSGAANCVNSCLEPMLHQRYGRIVLFSSRSVRGSPGHSIYAIAKGAILGFTHSLSNQLSGTGVCVNSVFPSGRTRASFPVDQSARQRRIAVMRARAHGISDPTAHRSSHEQDPENNAAMIAWLSSEAAGSISGRTFGTGGWQVVVYRPTAVTKITPLTNVLTTGQVLALSAD